MLTIMDVLYICVLSHCGSVNCTNLNIILINPDHVTYKFIYTCPHSLVTISNADGNYSSATNLYIFLLDTDLLYWLFNSHSGTLCGIPLPSQSHTSTAYCWWHFYLFWYFRYTNSLLIFSKSINNN